MPLFVLFALMDSEKTSEGVESGSLQSVDMDDGQDTIPPDHPAYDRVQSQTESELAPRKFNWLLAVGVLLFAAALLAAYFIARPGGGGGSGTPDLLSLAAINAKNVRLEVGTDDLDEAEDYILGEFGWPIRVPVLANSRLVGVGVDEIAEGVELPVMQYATDDNEPITVYVYDYAFLDAAAGRLALAPAVYARLSEDDGIDVRRIDDSYIILWRRRAVIYTAVTLEDPAPIVEALRRGR